MAEQRPLTIALVAGETSGDILSTNEAGGFTGAMIGLYATSVGY